MSEMPRTPDGDDGDAGVGPSSAAVTPTARPGPFFSPAAVAAEAGRGLDATATATARPSGGLLGLLALGVLVVAAAGYWFTRADPGAAPSASTDAAAVAPEPAASEVAAARAQFEAMTREIQARTEAQPEDAEAWAMLGRAHTVLERYAEAASAFERASALQPPDATLLVDHANALAMANGHRISPAAAALLEKALQLDPDHVKALAMGGSAALTARNPGLAIQRWEHLAGLLPPEHELQSPLRSSIAAARAQMKDGAVPAAAAAAASSTPPSGAPTAAAAGTSVAGRVHLSAALVAQAAPEDTVFIVARAAQGPRMPLAVLRRQVKDLPLDFTLDDSLSMSPAARLSGASSVIVSARVSRSGQAMPQPGDLSGESAAVAVGTQGLDIEITQVVKP